MSNADVSISVLLGMSGKQITPVTLSSFVWGECGVHQHLFPPVRTLIVSLYFDTICKQPSMHFSRICNELATHNWWYCYMINVHCIKCLFQCVHSAWQVDCQTALWLVSLSWEISCMCRGTTLAPSSDSRLIMAWHINIIQWNFAIADSMSSSRVLVISGISKVQNI